MKGRGVQDGGPSRIEAAGEDPDAQRWRIYVGNSLRAAPFQVVVGGLLLPIVWDQASRDPALLWFAAVLLAGLVRMGVGQACRHVPHQPSESIRIRLRG